MVEARGEQSRVERLRLERERFHVTDDILRQQRILAALRRPSIR